MNDFKVRVIKLRRLVLQLGHHLKYEVLGGIINNYNSFFFNMHPLSSRSAETFIERKFKGYYIYIFKSLPIYYKFFFKHGAVSAVRF